MWRAFCGVLAEHLVRNFPDKCSKSQQQRLHGNLWPLHEDEEE